MEEESEGSATLEEPPDTDELALFRQQWKAELGIGSETTPPGQGEEQAAGLYWMGAAAERSGDMYSAIMYYRQAVQLVPDIESKVSSHSEPHQDAVSEGCVEVEVGGGRGGEGGLVEAFQRLSFQAICQPERQTRETHLSALPVEVVRYILRWVVSPELDLRSLEMVGMVCRGLYLLAREPPLWRSACRRLWGSCSAVAYRGIWRDMFLHRPHLHFNGVYISKSSYVRQGERSLDSYYKPYHTVVYYRYLRFFADGGVVYLTSPEEPGSVVGRLSHSTEVGQYTLQGSQVSVEVVVYRGGSPPTRGRQRRRQPEAMYEQQLHMELVLRSSHRMPFSQLHWQEHRCHSIHRPTGRVQISHFTIDHKYTPFHFSRVRSYSTHSHGLLT